MINKKLWWNLSEEPKRVTCFGMLNQPLKKKPENIIINCGTNDISKDKDPGKIAADIINLS